MRRAVTRLTGGLLLLATFAVTTASALSLTTAGLPAPITLYGVASVRPGMTPGQVSARWGVEADTPGPGYNGCTGRAFSVRGLRVTALFERHTFSMATFGGTAHSGNGIRVGSNVTQLRRAYGTSLRSRAQPYASPAVRDYFVRKPTRPYAWLYFSMKRRRVQTISYGNRAVFYEEGCA